ncbi:GNAT family N-acetyltransferase [Nocardia sp. BMG51109]|uniref:GNAT family N-acetyltransferase n=1 Tax=Nocardia sp. BMG51109 TaxID=1056816 RepID=UPI0004669DEC|nr:GNAT family N-acetyltransferase [Nocardia sp. BMG51109]
MTVTHDVSIRQADDRDIPALARLRRQWSEEQAGRPLEDERFDEQFAQWYATESSRRTTFLAEIDSSAVGMVNLALFERMPRPGHPASRWGYLANAFVLAGHRNRGIGTALLNALVAYARDHGCVRIVLSPTDLSVPFYQRADFGPATMLLTRVLVELHAPPARRQAPPADISATQNASGQCHCTRRIPQATDRRHPVITVSRAAAAQVSEARDPFGRGRSRAQRQFGGLGGGQGEGDGEGAGRGGHRSPPRARKVSGRWQSHHHR